MPEEQTPEQKNTVSRKIAAAEVCLAEQKNVRSCMVGIVGSLLAAGAANIQLLYGGIVAFVVAGYLGYIMAQSRAKAKYLNDKYVLEIKV